jgi:hypothetical protein
MTAPVHKKQTKVASAGELQADYEAALRKRQVQYGAPQATVEAVMYELRTYGLAAIAGPNCQRRLANLSNAQLREVIERLDRLRPQYPAITDKLLLSLAELIHEVR